MTTLNPSQTQLKIVCNQNLLEVLSWFESARQVLYWGGPDLSFPLEIERFKAESKFDQSHSYVLTNENKVVAFGQLYNRLNHIHLGRLAVSPSYRGQGIGRLLIDELIAEGKRLLKLSKVSLFVLDDNTAALNLYQKKGFVVAQYPKEIPLKSCLYMQLQEKPE